MPLAMTVEHQWDLGLLAINVVVLLAGVPIAIKMGTADNMLFRVLWPAFGLLLLGLFAVFIYGARYYVK